jgi:hypothetical protein
MDRYLEALRAKFDQADVIYRREDRMVIRWRDTSLGIPIIIKMWARKDIRGKVRRLLHIAACDYEWRNLQRLEEAKVPVPRPLGFCRARPSIAGYIDVLFMEDLGPCETATEYLKRLIRTSPDDQAVSFENALIEMTGQMVNAGMIDVDHGLINIVVPPSGQPTKLDVELARRVFWPRLFSGDYGRMLGRLIALHTFAVQPDVNRAADFARRLRERLRPSSRTLKVADAHARRMMRIQFEKTGIDTRLVLPWD